MDFNKSAQPIDCTTATIEQLKNAIANRQPISGLKGAITHVGAQLDEIFTAYQMLKTDEGKQQFPGMSDGLGFYTELQLDTYKFCGTEGFYKALSKGFFIFGTGNGPFDEHDDRDSKISCSEIMANYLKLREGVDGRVIYGAFLNYVNYEDRNGNTLRKECANANYANLMAPALIAGNIKDGWKCVFAGLKDPQLLVAEVFGYIDNKLGAQRVYAQANRDYANSATKETIDLPFLKDEKGKKAVIHVVTSDNSEIVSAAKANFSRDQKSKMKALLAIKPNGQFYICPLHGATLKGVIDNLRALLAQKRKVDPSTLGDLMVKASIKCLKELYYHADSDSIMNGSNTQPDVPGLIGNEFTKEEVIQCIVDGIEVHEWYYASLK